MDMKDVLNNNLIIAKFIGGKVKEECLPLMKSRMNLNEIWVPGQTVCRFDTIDQGCGPVLQFHKKWDWLMPVVQEIKSESIFKNVSGDGMYYVLDLAIDEALSKVSIEKVYTAVTEFISWYNTKTSQ